MNRFALLVRNIQFQSLAISQVLTVLSNNLLVPVLPIYLKLQNYSDTQIGIIMGISAFGALVIRPLAGLIVDRRGSRQSLLGGQLFGSMCAAAFLWADSFLGFLAIRFCQGLSFAFQGTGAITFASCVETPQNMATAISLFTVFTMIGSGLGTGLAPTVYTYAGFYPLVIMSLLALGAAWSIMTFRAESIPPCPGEGRVSYLTVVRNRDVLSPTVCLFASNFAFGTAFTFVPLVALANNIPHYSLFYIAFTIAVVSTRLSVQFIAGRFSPERAASWGGVLNALCVLLLGLKASVGTFIIAGLLVGLGFGVIFPSLTLYVVTHTNPANKGAALSALSAAGDVGSALGAAVLGLVAEHFGYSALFYLSAGVVAICTYHFYVTLVRGRPKSAPVTET